MFFVPIKKVNKMSITVAVNATDSNNGPQVVCQSAQHNNCNEYNGGGGGGGDNDMAVFNHEQDQHEQVNITINVLEDNPSLSGLGVGFL